MEPLINGGAPFRRRNAPDLGISLKRLPRLVRAGRLRRVLRDVYVDSGVADEPLLRATAVALVMPAGGVICRRTAAWLFGIDAYAPDERDRLLDVECVVPAGFTPCRRDGVLGVSALLTPDDVVLCNGIPVTTPTRTAVDLARWAPRPMGLAALDAFCHAGITTLPELEDCVGKFPGFRWIAKARALVAVTEPLTESPGESWLRLRIIDAGFPRPRPQIEICDARGVLVYRIDLGYDSLRLGLEYDGMEFHDSRRDQEQDQARRESLRRDFGWNVIGFDRGHVLGRFPHVELAVGELLGQAPVLPRRW